MVCVGSQNCTISQKTENYLADLGREIVAKALEAQRNAKEANPRHQVGLVSVFRCHIQIRLKYPYGNTRYSHDRRLADCLSA